MKFVFVCGRACLNFAGTLKHRHTAREERLVNPGVLSEWAMQAGLVVPAVLVRNTQQSSTAVS